MQFHNCRHNEVERHFLASFCPADFNFALNMKKTRIITAVGLAVVFMLVVAAAVFPSFKRHVERVNCGNQMHVILFASSLMWADEHGGQLPSDFLSMSNLLVTPKILVCPGDHLRQPATDWASFTTNNCSYEIVAPGIYTNDTNVVFLRRKIHGYVGYSDDRIFDASGKLIRPDRFW